MSPVTGDTASSSTETSDAVSSGHRSLSSRTALLVFHVVDDHRVLLPLLGVG